MLETVTQYLDISKLLVRLKKEIENPEEHYAAMRSLEILESEIKNVKVVAMSNFLQNVIKKSKSKLLKSVLTEADETLDGVRLQIKLIGTTIIRRQVMISMIEAKRRDAGELRTLDYDINDNNNDNIRSMSLQYLAKNGYLYRLETWCRKKDIKNLLPDEFLEPPSPEGVLLLESLMGQLGPIHKALYMHAVLGESAIYHAHYRASREQFLVKVLEEAEIKVEKEGLVKGLDELLSFLVGFFGFELTLRRTVELTDGAFSLSENFTLWDNALQKLSQMCERYTKTIMTPRDVLIIKEELLIFSETVTDDAFGLRVHAIFEIIKNFWDKFEEVQVKAIVKGCVLSLKQSAFQPFYVSTEDVFISKIKAFRLDTVLSTNDFQVQMRHSELGIGNIHVGANKERMSINMTVASANLDALEEELERKISGRCNESSNENEQSGVSINNEKVGTEVVNNHDSDSNTIVSLTKASFTPQQYSFSAAVPIILHQLHLLVIRYVLFAFKNLHLGSRGETVCKSILKALNSVSEELENALLVDGKLTTLSKATQISVDAYTLSNSMDTIWLIIENFLNNFHWADSIETHLPLAMAQAKVTMNNIASQAQDLILELLAEKVDDLLGSLEFIELTPNKIPKVPHPVFDEIVEFLQVALMGLANLNHAAREAAHFTCCSKINSGFINFLLGPKVVHLNVLCVVGFDLDIKKLEHFADSTGIPQLRMCFIESKEIMKAILHPDLPNIWDPQFRKPSFPRLDPEKISTILLKMNSTPLGFTSTLPHLEKNMIKSLVKKIRKEGTEND